MSGGPLEYRRWAPPNAKDTTTNGRGGDGRRRGGGGGGRGGSGGGAAAWDNPDPGPPRNWNHQASSSAPHTEYRRWAPTNAKHTANGHGGDGRRLSNSTWDDSEPGPPRQHTHHRGRQPPPQRQESAWSEFGISEPNEWQRDYYHRPAGAYTRPLFGST